MTWSNTQKKWAIGAIALTIVLGTIVFWPTGYDAPNLPDKVDFNYHIRPLLSQNCFVCHGPDSSTREAGLRLDNLAGATAELQDGGAAIVPGNIRKSLLLHRISSDDPEVQMPPPSAKKILSEREIALLTKWIDQGAEWKPHWAFIKPEMPSMPRAKREASPAEVIDYLVDQKLEEQGLTSAARASQAALVRRVAYLLTGLPPTQEELMQFAQDSSVATYEEAVDHYLASPHFGERWARHWMDLVRYGESMGHEGDFNISHPWEYRDYLIRAFNQDVPFDLFVKEHLAGDMLTEARYNPDEDFNESIIGTGYFFLGEGKHAPVKIKLEEADKIDNVIDVTSKTFQALTVSCARCHDHKFDPIPTTDYYAMYGMFESSRIGPIPARRSKQQEDQLEQLAEIKGQIRTELGKQWREKLSDESVFQLTQYLQTKDTPEKTPKDPDDYQVIGDFRDGNFAGWFADGWAFGDGVLMGEPYFDSRTETFEGLESGFVSSRAVGKGVQGVLRSPNFIVEHDTIAVRAAGHHGQIRIIVDNFQVIQGPLYDRYEAILDEPEWKTYYFDVSLVKGHKAYLQFTPGNYGEKRRHIYKITPDDYIDVQYAVNYQNGMPDMKWNRNVAADQTVDKQKVLERWVQGQTKADDLPILHGISKTSENTKLADLLQKLAQKQSGLIQQLYDSTHFIGLTEGDPVFSSVFIRGSIDNQSEDKVPHQFFSFIEAGPESYPQGGSGRLAWAEAVVDSENPLTARVISNRLWHHLFGRGIVETVDNFGLQGKVPSHPELLDYLAIRIQEDDWSMKRLIKHILMTQSFQRSTEARVENAESDPNNLFLHHFPIRRLEAEAIRDGILAVSGRLNKEMYGPSIPVHLTNFMTGRGRPRTSGPMDGDGRRSIYIAVRRNFIPPMMLTFDTPIPFSTFGKRNTTNVPAQSLTLMNDPFVQEQAGIWAKAVLEQADESLEARVQTMYMKAFSRKASEEEMETARAFLASQAKGYDSSFEELKNDPKLWADYCHALINLKEFIHLL
ncbi:MAG: PSD1 and planctomycete cytochrome C domain-containing protein [Bacteroidota bacterium]